MDKKGAKQLTQPKRVHFSLRCFIVVVSLLVC